MGTRKLWKQILTESRFYWHPSLTLKSQPISKETTPSKEGDFKGPGAWERPSQDKERNKWFLDGVAWATMPISVPDSTAAMAMMIRNNAELQGRLLFFLVAQEFSTIWFYAAVPWGRTFTFSGPEFVCRESKVLEAHFCYSSSTPFGEPSAISKTHPGQPTIRESWGKKNISRFCFKKACSLIELWSFSPLNPALHLLRMSLVTFVWTFQWVHRRPRS